MRLVYTLAALCCIAATFARADQPQFFLRPDGSVEQRVAKVESDVSKLEARIADLERQLGTVAAKPKASAGVNTAAPTKVRYSVCSNGRCTVYETDAGSPIPAGATVLSGQPFGNSEQLPAASSPCPTGGCGDACGCVGVSSSSGGWFPGKLLGRRR